MSCEERKQRTDENSLKRMWGNQKVLLRKALPMANCIFSRLRPNYDKSYQSSKKGYAGLLTSIYLGQSCCVRTNPLNQIHNFIPRTHGISRIGILWTINVIQKNAGLRCTRPSPCGGRCRVNASVANRNDSIIGKLR